MIVNVYNLCTTATIDSQMCTKTPDHRSIANVDSHMAASHVSSSALSDFVATDELGCYDIVPHISRLPDSFELTTCTQHI